ARQGLAEDTVVIYTSDHGENKGDHGLWWKNCMYEHGARVPLIVSWPARWAGGQRRSGVCSLLDLVQTIAAIAEAELPEHCDGDSLVPLLDDPSSAWKDCAISEYYSHPICSGFQMYRQGPWKYVYHTRPDEAHEPERELYHLGDDPGEFHNLAEQKEQAERCRRMHDALVAELGDDPDAIEQRCRNDFARAEAAVAR
ncbi:MAG: sulfatase, partial [Planctomycetota bacterium]